MTLLVRRRPGVVREGGDARVAAWVRCVERLPGGVVVEVEPEAVVSWGGAVRCTVRALAAVARAGNRLVVTSFPNLPFGFRGLGLRVPAVLLATLALRLACRLLGRRLACDVPDLPAEQIAALGVDIAGGRRAALASTWVALHAADLFFAQSTAFADHCARRYRVARRRLVLLPNGGATVASVPAGHLTGGRTRRRPSEGGATVPAIRGRRAAGRPGVTFACAGTLRERFTGPVVDAFLAGAGSGDRLVLLGPGGEWVAARGPDRRVAWVGALPEDEAGALLAACDAGVVPNPDVPYVGLIHPVKLSAYLVAGLAILAADSPTVAAVVERLGVGLCLPADRLAEGFARLSSDPALLARLRAAAAGQRAEWTWERLIRRAVAEAMGRG